MHGGVRVGDGGESGVWGARAGRERGVRGRGAERGHEGGGGGGAWGAVCVVRWGAPSPEVSNSRKMSMTSPGLRPREVRSSCILSTTWIASFSDQTWLGCE